MSERFFEDTTQAVAYVKSRPSPPTTLITRLLDYLRHGYKGVLEAAVDVGCGSGQCTQVLVPHFTSITAIDVSEAQIQQARTLVQSSSVTFKVGGAECLPLGNNSVQLVVSGQACHWFNMKQFFNEAHRVLVNGGVLALYCYSLPRFVHPGCATQLQALTDEMLYKTLREFWPDHAFDTEKGYQDKRFIIPYTDFQRDNSHYVEREVTVADLVSMINSWSGFPVFQERHGPAVAQKVLDDYQDKLMSTLGVNTPPQDTPVLIREDFHLLLGRKQL